MTTPMSLMERLRAETHTLHARVETLPFVATLQGAVVPTYSIRLFYNVVRRDPACVLPGRGR